MSRPKDLTDAHWKYIKELLEFDYLDKDVVSMSKEAFIELIGFHYKSSGIHFYGHGVEDTEKRLMGSGAYFKTKKEQPCDCVGTQFVNIAGYTEGCDD